MTWPKSTPPVTYVEGYGPEYIGRITQMHGEYYPTVWGSGAGFEILMARELCEFCERYHMGQDLLLTAHIDGVLVGCVAIDGTQSERPGLARLRWFLLDETYQGQWIGSELLHQALAFCRVRDFPLIYLWTVRGLPGSLHLYEKAGFRVVQELEDSRYTVEHTQLMMEKQLSARFEAGDEA